MGEQLPPLHQVVPVYRAGAEEEKRSEIRQSVPARTHRTRKVPPLDLPEGASEAGKGPQRSRAGTMQMLP